MLEKLNRTFKKLNLIQGTREKCAKLRHGWKNERGKLVCRLIHIMYIVVTTVGAVPFRVSALENGYQHWIPVEGIRKWFGYGHVSFMILRAISYALLPTSSKLKLAKGGMLTADCLIWALSIAVAVVPAIVSFKLGRQPKESTALYNSFVEAMRSVSIKHLDGKHGFELVDIHWAMLCVIGGMCAGIILAPVLATLPFIPLKDAPAFLSYHIAGPYCDIRDDDTLRFALYWAGAIVHWLYLYYIDLLMIILIVMLGEMVIQSTLLIKITRSHESTTMNWREKLKFHAQAELLITVYNDWVGLATPVALLAALMLSVCGNIAVMKMDLEMGFPSIAVAPILSLFRAGGAIGGYVFLKYAEELRENSIGLLADIEAEINAYWKLRGRKRKRITYYPTGRTFRRRPLGLHLGSFMYLDSGMSISYLMQIVDNTVSYFFMVDLRSHPVWMW